jgi:flagellar biosynthetic protein FliR
MEWISDALQNDAWSTQLCAASRLGGVFLSVPLFSSRLVPARIRVAMLAIFLLALPAISPLPGIRDPASRPVPVESVTLTCLGGELLIGCCLGWFAFLLMGAIRGGATIVSDQIGFSLGGVLDPLSEGEEAGLRTFQGLFALYVFLAANMHLAFLRGVSESFRVLPPGTLSGTATASILERMVLVGGLQVFEVALSVGFPIMAMLLLVTIVQGVLMKVVPELEFLVFGFSLRALVGVGVCVLMLPLLASRFQGLFHRALADGSELVHMLSG